MHQWKLSPPEYLSRCTPLIWSCIIFRCPCLCPGIGREALRHAFGIYFSLRHLIGLWETFFLCSCHIIDEMNSEHAKSWLLDLWQCKQKEGSLLCDYKAEGQAMRTMHNNVNTHWTHSTLDSESPFLWMQPTETCLSCRINYRIFRHIISILILWDAYACLEDSRRIFWVVCQGGMREHKACALHSLSLTITMDISSSTYELLPFGRLVISLVAFPLAP